MIQASSLISSMTSITQSPDSKRANILAPFSSVDSDNKHRPYFAAPIQHDANTATIVLVKKNPQGQPKVTAATDYFSEFSTSISSVNKNLLPNDYNEIPALDKVGSNFYGVFKNFSILGQNEVRAEISKVALNFGGKWNAYFFGSQPRVYAYTGIFLDAKNYPYYEQFMVAYDNYLAGGKCVSNNFKMYIACDGKITSGYMLGIDTNSQSDEPFHKTFSFRILVDDENFYRANYVYNPDGSFLEEVPNKLDNRYLIPGADLF